MSNNHFENEIKIIEDINYLFLNVFDKINWNFISKTNLKEFSLNVFKECVLNEFVNKKQELQQRIFKKYNTNYSLENENIILNNYYKNMYNNLEIIKYNNDIILCNYLKLLNEDMTNKINKAIQKYILFKELDEIENIQHKVFNMFISIVKTESNKLIKEYFSLLFIQ